MDHSEGGSSPTRANTSGSYSPVNYGGGYYGGGYEGYYYNQRLIE